ncbi:unnamed protein product [Clonostachys rhizophaga]|uniref:Major facilitator superfamily (MFS) profile domain-containing protein n=1 Tax=Clonostachys rhizophaga TaxID=160324 RepID=A0A9N9V9X7_9HYPO|nr:unnamed protein product [Clonostachys rhizophaga]
MKLNDKLSNTTFVRYVRAIKASPRSMIFNRHLLLSAAGYAMSGICISWDQASSSVIPALPGFQAAFGIQSAANPKEISNFVSFVFLTAGLGSAVSFFINDRIGRLWSMRLYFLIWIVGQLIATFSNGHLGVLYAARLVSGLGIGPLTVTGPISIVEIAPPEIRGLLTVWFNVVMLTALTSAPFVSLACLKYLESSRLQYQIVFFAPTIVVSIVIVLSFFIMHESPRWLMLVGREEEGIKSLLKLRGLPLDHPRVVQEIQGIRDELERDRALHGDGGSLSIIKEALLVPSNLRRLLLVTVAYCLAQLSGANSLTSYLVAILDMLGQGGDRAHSITISGFYSLSKLFYTLIASFFFIDAVGRRNSLFIGIIIQAISDLYIAVFIHQKQAGADISPSASQAAIAAIFIHGFGWAIGLLILPYVFGAELWTNRIRSFGSAFTQAFHWWFFFGMTFATPNILSSMNNWGAFLFFTGICCFSLAWSYFTVPETAGLSVEEMNDLFTGSWWRMSSQAKKIRAKAFPGINGIESGSATTQTKILKATPSVDEER